VPGEVNVVRLALLALLTVVLVLPARAGPGDIEPAPGNRVIGDGVIVPGQRIGSIRLTMTLPQMIEAVGPVYKREEFKAEKILLYEWRAEGIWISLDLESNRIRVVSAFGANSKYRTDKRVALLDHFSKAEKIYGQSYRRWEFREDKIVLIRYPVLGLQFGLVNDPAQRLLLGRIFQIGIFQPGDLPPARQP